MGKRQKHFDRIAQLSRRYSALRRSLVERLANSGYLTKEGAIAARGVLSTTFESDSTNHGREITLPRVISASTLFVFLNWAWSGQAKEGLRVARMAAVEENVELIVCEPDREAGIAEWLTSECLRMGLPLHGGGHGSLLLVHSGQVLNVVFKVHRETVASLRATIRAWLCELR